LANLKAAIHSPLSERSSESANHCLGKVISELCEVAEDKAQSLAEFEGLSRVGDIALELIRPYTRAIKNKYHCNLVTFCRDWDEDDGTRNRGSDYGRFIYDTVVETHPEAVSTKAKEKEYQKAVDWMYIYGERCEKCHANLGDSNAQGK
jgi:hypothetical protein